MTKLISTLILLSGILFSTISCEKSHYLIEKNIEIVNHSSCRVAGSFNMGLSTFDLAPAETWSTSITSREDKYPDVSQVTVAGPNILTIDGRDYTLKSTAPANGFFELYGWEVTKNDKRFNLKMDLTDEGLARVLAEADVTE